LLFKPGVPDGFVREVLDLTIANFERGPWQRIKRGMCAPANRQEELFAAILSDSEKPKSTGRIPRRASKDRLTVRA
jgi:hypothetical protein